MSNRKEDVNFLLEEVVKLFQRNTVMLNETKLHMNKAQTDINNAIAFSAEIEARLTNLIDKK